MRIRAAIGVSIVVGMLGGAGLASAKPITMPTIGHEQELQRTAAAAGVAFPPPPCPENGLVNSVLQSSVGNPGLPIGNCGVAQPVATTLPWPGNMSYYGGGVQVHPKEYLVLWGWGDSGAFPGRYCVPETFSEPLADGTTTSQTVGCDPDGAAKYMADFLAQMGGTQWAGVSTQYTQADGQSISNDKNVLAGIWIDDGNNPNLSGTNMNNPAGSTNTYTDLAAEASRAAGHFGIPDSQLIDSNIIVAQPAGFSDPNAQSLGYCAFHDYTESDASGNWYYQDPSVKQGILGKSTALAYTNMPYVLNNGSSCGEDAVNSKSNGGDIDGFSIVLGHEVEETITDPGGEATVGDVTTANQSNASTGGATFFGAWYDATDPNENGDKCAWVGQLVNNGLTGDLPGSPGDIVGNAGERFAVQSLWSNAAAQGTGYCSGVASTDLPSQAGDGEQGGAQYAQASAWTPPSLGCNLEHVFVDNGVDAPDPFSPSPSSPTSGSQQDQLDMTQGDFVVASGTLKITLTIRNLSTSTSLPSNDNEYSVSWSEGANAYGAQVLVDGTGNVTASDSTTDSSGTQTSNALPASAVKFTPGQNGTIEIDVPLADVGNPQPGGVLQGISAASADVVNANVPGVIGYPGFFADQDGNATPFIVGATTCGAASTGGAQSTSQTGTQSASTGAPTATTHLTYHRPASACPAQARLTLALPKRRGGRYVEALIYINGHLAESSYGRHLRHVVLSRPSARRFRLKLVAVLSNGKRVTTTWRYNGCSRTLLRR